MNIIHISSVDPESLKLLLSFTDFDAHQNTKIRKL